jgi:DNA-binding transcriptional MerR regulator
MSTDSNRRYLIGEVAELAELPVHTLRQWQEHFPQLKPKRDRANRRYYTAKDIDIVKRIKTLLRHEKMTIPGARVRLAQELHGEGRPRTNREALELARQIEREANALLRLLDNVSK